MSKLKRRRVKKVEPVRPARVVRFMTMNGKLVQFRAKRKGHGKGRH